MGEVVLLLMNGATYVAAAVASNSVKPSLEIKDIELDLSEIASTNELTNKEGKYVCLFKPSGRHGKKHNKENGSI